MAYCSRCGKEVREDYNICPNCGNNLKQVVVQQQVSNKRQPTGCLVAIIVFLVICIFSAVIARNGTSSTKSESKYNTSKTYSIGDKLTCPNFDVTVDEVKIKKKGTRIDSYSVIDDPEWIGVILTVKNTSSETETFYTSKVDLTNSNGEVLEHSWMTYKIWGTEILDSPELVSGGEKTGYVQYSNPSTDNSKLTLTIDCTSGLFGDTVKYKVDISQKEGK